jgi:hypothetical protein
MGRGKRPVAISRARAGISLSDTPRARKRVPVFASLASYDYSSGFAPIVTRIVGLHVHDAWNLAEEVYGQDVELALLREPDNATTRTRSSAGSRSSPRSVTSTLMSLSRWPRRSTAAPDSSPVRSGRHRGPARARRAARLASGSSPRARKPVVGPLVYRPFKMWSMTARPTRQEAFRRPDSDTPTWPRASLNC